MSQRISSKLIGVIVTGALFCTPGAFASTVFSTEHVCVTDAIRKDNRPEPDKECPSGLDVYQLFPEYIGYDGSFP